MITHISPAGSMDLLSQLEVQRLKKEATSEPLSAIPKLHACGAQFR